MKMLGHETERLTNLYSYVDYDCVELGITGLPTLDEVISVFGHSGIPFELL